MFANHNVALHGSRLGTEKYKHGKVFLNETYDGVKRITLVSDGLYMKIFPGLKLKSDIKCLCRDIL
jgi:hypothetical protein